MRPACRGSTGRYDYILDVGEQEVEGWSKDRDGEGEVCAHEKRRAKGSGSNAPRSAHALGLLCIPLPARVSPVAVPAQPRDMWARVLTVLVLTVELRTDEQERGRGMSVDRPKWLVSKGMPTPRLASRRCLVRTGRAGRQSQRRTTTTRRDTYASPPRRVGRR